MDDAGLSNEHERLQALASMDIMDTPAEEAFDRLTRMAADLFDTPIALISLVDETRQWFKSKVGLDATETPRAISFCQHTIRSDKVMVVEDATQNETFRDNPLVVGAPDIRFYAGAPLRLNSGMRLGSFCVIDTKPRELTPVERRRLQTLAQIAVDEMELRIKSRELEAAKLKAEAAAEAKSDFLANMSHELRTPLTSIIGFAGLLLGTGKLEQRERHFAERIQASGQNLLVLVNDVLDFAKLEAGRVELMMEEVETAPFVEDILAQFREMAAGKNLDLTLEIGRGVPAAFKADPQAVRQILTNLISNAIKFTTEGGVTLAITRPADGGLSMAVTDTGVGIAPDALAQVFERFVQADSSVSRKFGGTGLGLSISQRLAGLMDASLTVASTLGAGSTFELRLPPRD